MVDIEKLKAKMPKGQRNLVDITLKVASACIRMEASMEAIIERMKAGATTDNDIKELTYMLEQTKEFKKTFRRFKYIPKLSQLPKDFQRNIDRFGIIKKALETSTITKQTIELAGRALVDLNETGQGTMKQLGLV